MTQRHPTACADRPPECALHIHQALFYACGNGRTAEARRLIAEGAPVDWQKGDGRAPLHWASAFGHTEMVMLLLENKCNLNVTDKLGSTPLIYAARLNKRKNVRALVEAGCDITIHGRGNRTATDTAKAFGRHAIEEYLRSIRFLPSSDDESDKPHGARGGATRAIRRDLQETGLLPTGPLSLIKEFATG